MVETWASRDDPPSSYSGQFPSPPPKKNAALPTLLEGAVEHCHHHAVKRIVALGVEGAEASDAVVGEPLGKRFGL